MNEDEEEPEEEMTYYYNIYGERILFPEYYDIICNQFGEIIAHPLSEEEIINDSSD